MPSTRRLAVRFEAVQAGARSGGVGLELDFRPLSPRQPEALRDWADLGPALTVPAVAGVGKVIRILRAARIAPPREPLRLVGHADEAGALLSRALGTALALEVRPRSRLRFVAWTELGVEAVDDVADVIESAEAWLIVRRGGRFPVRIPRADVVRQHTECERWLEIVGVERA
jgi:hypothetical protein